MKAYQIVIKGDERSEKYAKISRQSFEPLITIGVIDEIITFDAITPESDNFEEHMNRYSWKPSLMLAPKPQTPLLLKNNIHATILKLTG